MSMKHRATNEQLVALIKSGEDTAGNMEQLCRQVEGFIRSMAYKHNGVEEFNRTWTSSTERLAMKL